VLAGVPGRGRAVLHGARCPAVLERGPPVREELLLIFSWHLRQLCSVDNQNVEKLNSGFVAGGGMRIQHQFFKR